MEKYSQLLGFVFSAPLEACSSSPCENGGSCIDVNVDAYVCMCRDEYFGITCSESKTNINLLLKLKSNSCKLQKCNNDTTVFHTGYSDTPFLVTFDTTPMTPGDPIVFNYIAHNTGGHYDPSNGFYTTPVAGTYEFIFRFRAYQDADLGAHLVVDGVQVSLLNIN